MALKLKNKAAASTASTEKPAAAEVDHTTPTKAGGGSFLMKGKAAKQALADEQKAAAVRQEQRDNSVMRFYVKPEGERTITFLDGGLDSDGDLDSVCFYEHSINNKALRYPKYVCINDPANNIVCPICSSGNGDPYFVTVFTVLTHDTWHSKKLKKDVEGDIQLFVAKTGVADKLRKKAKKIGGLAGATFEVSRTNDDAWNVGDDFDFVQHDTLADLQAGFPDCDVQPLDYDKVIQVHSVEELVALGYGTQTTAVGSEGSVAEDEVL